jgi:hypothetical protein
MLPEILPHGEPSLMENPGQLALFIRIIKNTRSLIWTLVTWQLRLRVIMKNL